jgi:hypothetical protein
MAIFLTVGYTCTPVCIIIHVAVHVRCFKRVIFIRPTLLKACGYTTVKSLWLYNDLILIALADVMAT